MVQTRWDSKNAEYESGARYNGSGRAYNPSAAPADSFTRMKPIEHTTHTDTPEEIVLNAGKLPRLHIGIAKTVDEKSVWQER